MSIKHHFFGLECQIDRELIDRGNIEKALHDKGWIFKAINFVNQVHSSEIIVIDDEKKILPKQNLPKADGIVCNLPNVAIAVFTADCAPIIFKDEENGVVAIVHAGWRGAKDSVIENAIEKMCEIGAKKSKIHGFLGPMIHQKSYQVSGDFYDDFILQNQANALFFVKDKEEGKFLFDLVGFVKKKVQDAGVSKLDDVNIDSYENFERYASYRKACHDSAKSSGRNISIAMIEGA